MEGHVGPRRSAKRLRTAESSSTASGLKVLRASDLAPTRSLTTGCPLLDEALCGGLRTGCVNELVGESNCGKTQLCLQLLLTSQWTSENGGLGCKSLYINTEGSGGVTATRLREFAEFHASRGFLGGDAAQASLASMDNIFIERCTTDDPHALLSVLARARTLLEHHNVRLIVVDSIANAFKAFSSAGSHHSRLTQVLYSTVALLKKYASDYGACVVLTNHVADHIDRVPAQRAAQAVTETLRTSGKVVRPSLGASFAQGVTCRFFVSRISSARLNENRYDTSGCVRELEVVFSPYQSKRKTKYIINQSGVWGIPEEVYREGHE